MPDEMKELSLRIERIERMVESIAVERAPSAAADLSADEISAFRKVRDVVAQDFERFCGINDCFRCIVTRCGFLCEFVCGRGGPCDVECSCGPCGFGGGGGGFGGRVNRFGNLG